MTKVKLSKRLKTIADMVTDAKVLADIGCDHALLDIYLIQYNIIKKSLACDITEGALNQAKKNIKLYNVKNIKTVLSDGLDKLSNKDQVDTIVLSGLGNIKIKQILYKNKEKLKDAKNIIIQSNTGICDIRKSVTNLGYYIEDEKLIEENKIIYTVISFKKGLKKYSKKELEFGPILLKNKDELFKKNAQNIINKNNHILNNLPASKIIKKLSLIIKNIKIKKMLLYK